MTTLPWEDRYTFGGFDLSSYAVMTMNVDGADVVPPARGVTPPRTGMSGNVPQRLLMDQRSVRIGLFLTPDSAAGVAPGDNRVGAYSNLDALKRILDPTVGQQLLTRMMPDGTTRQGMAQVRSTSAFAGVAGGELMMLTVDFELADPYWYASIPVSLNTTLNTSPVNANITNPGYPGHRTTFDFTGPITAPVVTNTTTGAFISFPFAVPSAQHLIIDAYTFTATLNGVDRSGDILHAPTVGVPWWRMNTGVNALTFTGTSPTGSCLTVHTPAYL